MKEYPKFSVAMTVYYKESATNLSKALDSVFYDQTIRPNEIVIVEDGPLTKELDKTIDSFAKKTGVVKIVKLSHNCGHGIARKYTIDNCQYSLIAIMDSDDISLPTRFEQQLELFNQNEQLDVVGGHISEFIGTEENVVSYRKVRINQEDIYNDLKYRCPFNHVTVMYKKESVLKAGNYEDFLNEEDYYLWAKMALNKCKFLNIDEVLVNVRTGVDQYARRGGIKYYKSEQKMQRFLKNNSLITSYQYCINCTKRFIIQVLLPKSIRGYLIRKYAREQ